MYLLVTSNDCASAGLASIIIIVKRGLQIIQIVGPILLILSLVVGFTKGVFSPDDKKSMKKLFNSILAVIILFLVPIFVNAIMGVLGENFTVSECWNSAETSITGGESEYRDPYDQDKTKIIDNKEYEPSDS